jgi:hypothetical protein
MDRSEFFLPQIALIALIKNKCISLRDLRDLREKYNCVLAIPSSTPNRTRLLPAAIKCTRRQMYLFPSIPSDNFANMDRSEFFLPQMALISQIKNKCINLRDLRDLREKYKANDL